jgi:hypothetical protein
MSHGCQSSQGTHSDTRCPKTNCKSSPGHQDLAGRHMAHTDCKSSDRRTHEVTHAPHQTARDHKKKTSRGHPCPIADCPQEFATNSQGQTYEQCAGRVHADRDTGVPQQTVRACEAHGDPHAHRKSSPRTHKDTHQPQRTAKLKRAHRGTCAHQHAVLQASTRNAKETQLLNTPQECTEKDHMGHTCPTANRESSQRFPGGTHVKQQTA